MARESILDSGRAEEIAADEMWEHWHSTMNGRCACGELIGRDPKYIAKHVAYKIIDKLREAQDELD